jgi:monofunctional biosynthetic peptidoglycan transglycosylase
MTRRRLLRLLVLVGGVLLGATTLLAAWLWWSLPDVAPLASRFPSTTAYIETWVEGERAAGRTPHLRWVPVPYARISDTLKRAVLVAEDIGFFSHDGFDTHEIEAALKEAWQEKSLPRGASTLTQQLARNLYLSPARTPWRKLQEALITRRIEARLDKRRILELYLNVVEMGEGIYGAEAASRHWFGHPAALLDESEAAQLAAVLPRPKVWHPGSDTRGYQAAVQRILRRMERAGFLQRHL